MENSTPALKLSRRMILLLVLVALIGFFSGVFIRLLPCQHCEKAVLSVGSYKVFGEHRLYCPWSDK